MEALPLHKDIPVEQTWNLADLLEQETDFDPALTQVVEDAANFERLYKGSVSDAQKVIEVLIAYEALQESIVPVGVYASLNLEVDRTNDVAQMRAAKFGAAVAKISSSLSFVRSELLNLLTTTLEEATTLSPLGTPYGQKNE